MEVSAENSFERRKSRRRFRVPYEMFVEIVRECDDGDIFGVYQRKRKIPTEFKVLASLRILGRDICCDEIEERLNISESHTNLFFKQFLSNYAEKLYSKYVYVPQNEELHNVVETYRRMGFPGCVGSMDVTHIYWDKCPKRLRFLCKGKEGKPTLAFQCVVDHSKRIHHLSAPFFGATNDISITYQDTYPILLLNKQLHGDFIFQTFTREGDVTFWKGGYL
jgi:hypothetical protein